MLKDDFKAIDKKGIKHLYINGKQLKYKPWLGDFFSIFYDSIMKSSVYPKKLEASIEKHMQFLRDEFKDTKNNTILELATGSGNMSEIIPQDNTYIGTDISKGLLKIALKRFSTKGLKDVQFYICSAKDIPFKEKIFDVCICNLSLNFFTDLDIVVRSIKKVLKNEGVFICCVPIPERMNGKSVIRGTLRTKKELKEIFESNGFDFFTYHFFNGSLLYFKCVSKA